MDGKQIIKRIVHSIIWLGILTWMTVIMGFVSGAKKEVLCQEIAIDISDSLDIKFVTTGMIREVLAGSGINTQGNPVEAIQTRELEFLIEQNPYVANAEVHVNIDGLLKVSIDQRKPLMRVMPGGKGGYYIDQDGYKLPLSDTYSPMVLLFTGRLEFEEFQGESSATMVDTTKQEISNLMAFARYVQSSDFWNQQIVQIYRNRSAEYELIPRVGAHQIFLGTLENYRTKLRNLKLLYEQGFSAYGWNTYDKINLSYSNQIICTKR
ncbi:cell division protein FtsQ/DivIB [Bacteroidota bacterium]